MNLKTVDFLDVCFNLTNDTYEPYRKPNNEPVYININSNHSRPKKKYWGGGGGGAIF